ncbi:MAG: HAD hydrolase-like protein [Thermodesulfovibrionales bacterium]|nr:HAD hydrolase-like protein [Thermodesulfovibrionales bacterium]
MKLVLFDIDGTLVNTGGAGSRALSIVFKNLFSITDAFRNISMAGKTDIQIIKEGLKAHRLPINDHIVNDAIKLYIEILNIEINNDRKYIMPGVTEVLETINNQTNFYCLGLLTGNVEEGARIKLKAFNLDRFFKFGAFGSDDEDRNKLLPFAIKRFSEIYNRQIKFKDCVIIGDTPRDIECAKSHDAFCIAVATGPYELEHLQKAGADIVMKDLSNTTEFFESLRNLFS